MLYAFCNDKKRSLYWKQVVSVLKTISDQASFVTVMIVLVAIMGSEMAI
jgi:hypothetical protein